MWSRLFPLLILVMAGGLSWVLLVWPPKGQSVASPRTEVSTSRAWFEGTWKVLSVSGRVEGELRYPEDEYYTFRSDGSGQFRSATGPSEFHWTKQGYRLQMVSSDRSEAFFVINEGDYPLRLMLTRLPEELRYPFESVTTVLLRP